VERPDKELKAFSKVHLAAGEKKKVTMVLPKSSFEYFNGEVGKWVFERGRYEILIGTSSRGIKFSKIIEFPV
jgi:beta-glucosidase